MARDPLRRGLDPPVKVAVPVRGGNRQPPCQAVAMLDWVPRWLRVAFGVLVMGLVVWFLVIPQFGQAEQALDAITGVHVGFVLLGGLLVAAAIASQAELTRAILPAGPRPSLPDRVRMEQIGSASGRERVCQSVWISVCAVVLKKKKR